MTPKNVLISKSRLAKRVRELAREIERDFRDKDLVVVAVLSGTVIFLADLIREMRIPLHLDFIGVSSYRSGTTSGKLRLNRDIRLSVKGRSVLIVEDILDTGKTLHHVIKVVRRLKPAEIKVCVLLNKSTRRTSPVEADYSGFYIPDKFVVGYGLDFAEQYRNLPHVAVLSKP